MEKRLMYLSVAVLSVTLAACAVLVSKALVRTMNKAQAEVERAVTNATSEARLTREALDARLASLESTVAKETQSTRVAALSAIDSTAERLDGRLASVQVQALEIADRRLGEVTTSLDSTAMATNEVLASTNKVVNHVEPWVNCGGSGYGEGQDCFQRKFWWVTLKADSMMTEIAKAAPTVATSVAASAVAAQEAATSAALTSNNIAMMTKPGPKWLRYVGLGATIAAPAAQIALPFAISAINK